MDPFYELDFFSHKFYLQVIMYSDYALVPLPAPTADTHTQHTPSSLHELKYSNGNALLSFLLCNVCRVQIKSHKYSVTTIDPKQMQQVRITLHGYPTRSLHRFLRCHQFSYLISAEPHQRFRHTARLTGCHSQSWHLQFSNRTSWSNCFIPNVDLFPTQEFYIKDHFCFIVYMRNKE